MLRPGSPAIGALLAGRRRPESELVRRDDPPRRARCGITARQFAAALTPGPEPCSSNTGGMPLPAAGAPVSISAVSTPAATTLLISVNGGP
jgi:hypothetical protein